MLNPFWYKNRCTYMRMHLVIGPRKFCYTQYDVVVVFALFFGC